MTDRLQELNERKDIEQQIAADKALGDYQIKATQARLETTMKRDVELQNTVGEMHTNARNAVEQIERMKRSEDEKHKQDVEKARKIGREEAERLGTQIDEVTKETLDSVHAKTREVDELKIKMDIEINQAKEKNKEKEVKMGAAVFNEKIARQEKNELLSDQRREQLNERQADSNRVELEGVQAQRNHQNESKNKLAVMKRQEAQMTQSLATLNLTMQTNMCDRNNRAFINDKIYAIKRKIDDLTGFYDNAYGKLSLNPEQYAKLKPAHLESVGKALNRFREVLKSISDELSCCEQKLASLELEDVDKAEEIRLIKKKTSEFSEVLAYLRTMVQIEEKSIEKEKVDKFTTLKEELYDMINNIEPIPQGRTQIIENINQLKQPKAE